jgi:hypothetical protein
VSRFQKRKCAYTIAGLDFVLAEEAAGMDTTPTPTPRPLTKASLRLQRLGDRFSHGDAKPEPLKN